MYKGLVGLTFVVLLVSNSAVFLPRAIAGDAPKPDFVIARHLESIGAARARSDVKSRADEGTVEFRILSGAVGGATTGNSVFLSEGRKTLFMMKFPTVEYSGERFIFDGNRMEIRAATAQLTRSALGDFLWVQNVPIKEGLLGGVLTTAWPLLDLDKRKAKLSYEGLKTIDGKQMLDLRYRPKKRTDLDIHLYFDPETFRHLRSVYTLTVAAGLGRATTGPMGIPPGGADSNIWAQSAETATARQNETRHRLEERFADFAAVDGLTLPMHYTLQFTYEQQNGHTVLSQWDVKLDAIKHNVSPDPRNFQVK